MANPAAYGPQNAAPFTRMGSTSLVPQYPQFQAPFQPQAQYMQQPPQHGPQPGGYQPGFNMQLTPGFPNMGFAAGQQQLAPQAPADAPAANSSQKRKKKPNTELIQAKNVGSQGVGYGALPTGLSVTGRPGKDNFVAETDNPNATISTGSGPRGRDVIDAQYKHHQSMHGGDSRVITAMMSVPLMSSGLPEPSRGREASDSTENLFSTKKGGRRQKPGKPQAQSQAPAPAPAPAQPPAQAQPQGQQFPPCANCNRADHLVGDCVGPPNQIHGDLAACPNCNSFAGGRKETTGPTGHRFDDCRHVKDMLDHHQWDTGHRLAYPDLPALTDDELLMFFRSLVAKRVRKVPIRTKLVCWIDVLREAVRRFHDTDIINSLGNMTPWTKTFSIQQYNLVDTQAKPWEFYDYAAGITLSLPAGPVEQAQEAWEDFVAKGIPGFPAQVFVNSDRN